MVISFKLQNREKIEQKKKKRKQRLSSLKCYVSSLVVSVTSWVYVSSGNNSFLQEQLPRSEGKRERDRERRRTWGQESRKKKRKKERKTSFSFPFFFPLFLSSSSFLLFLSFSPLRGRKRPWWCKPLVTTCFISFCCAFRPPRAGGRTTTQRGTNAHQHAYCCCRLRLSAQQERYAQEKANSSYNANDDTTFTSNCLLILLFPLSFLSLPLSLERERERERGRRNKERKASAHTAILCVYIYWEYMKLHTVHAVRTSKKRRKPRARFTPCFSICTTVVCAWSDRTQSLISYTQPHLVYSTCSGVKPEPYCSA